MWCDECQGTGFVDCHCGGDLCICENNGERECPVCHGMPGDDLDVEDDASVQSVQPMRGHTAERAAADIIIEDGVVVKSNG